MAENLKSYFGTPEAPQEIPSHLREGLDGTTGRRQELESIDPAERKQLAREARRLSWDALDLEKVFDQRGTLENNLAAHESDMRVDGYGQEEIEEATANLRQQAIEAMVADSLPYPEATAVDEKGRKTSRRAVERQRKALSGMLSMDSDVFDKTLEKWVTYDQLKALDEFEKLKMQATKEDRGFKAGPEARRARKATKELNEKHDGLFERIGGLPIEWDELQAVIEDDQVGYASVLKQYKKTPEYRSRIGSAKERYVGAESQSRAENFVIRGFTNRYVRDVLMDRVLAAYERQGLDADTIQEDLAQAQLDLRTLLLEGDTYKDYKDFRNQTNRYGVYKERQQRAIGHMIRGGDAENISPDEIDSTIQESGSFMKILHKIGVPGELLVLFSDPAREQARQPEMKRALSRTWQRLKAAREAAKGQSALLKGGIYASALLRSGHDVAQQNEQWAQKVKGRAERRVYVGIAAVGNWMVSHANEQIKRKVL